MQKWNGVWCHDKEEKKIKGVTKRVWKVMDERHNEKFIPFPFARTPVMEAYEEEEED